MNQRTKSLNTQETIINTSFDLFYKNGYNNTTIPEIMKATKLTKGAFYHHFKNKKEIGSKVISLIIGERIHNGMIQPLSNYKQENIVKLLAKVFTKRLLSFSEDEKKNGCPANNLINEIGQTEPEHRVLLRNIIEKWKNTLVEVITYGQKKQEIRNTISPLATATFLISAFEGIRGIRKVYDNDDLLHNYLKAVELYIEQLKQ